MNKLTICGLGLIGGSIGLAARERRLARVVCGLVRRPESLREAKKRGVVDFATMDPAEALAGADMVVIAATLGAAEQIARQIKPRLPEDCVVTDVGSCKQRVIERARKALGRGVRFVGVHPIAGSEQSGMSFAYAGLFEKAPCIVTPVRGTDSAAVKKVSGFWKALGSRVSVMSPEKHDRVVAAISHLPHFLAASLVNASVATLGREKTVLDYAGSGFRDTTRVAASGAEMWEDIAMDNAGEILRAVAALEKQLAVLKKALRRGDRESIRAILTRAAALRRKLNAG
ncbi:MAG: prephenate dehydrogenase [Chlamydiota bacterium]